MKKNLRLITAALLIFFGTETASSISLLQGRVPGYKIKTLAGKRISLKDYRGNPLLLNFWATWCAPCRKEFPIIKEIEKKFGKDGLVVLAVNVDDTRTISAVKSFVSAHSLNFTIPLDPNRKLLNNFRGSALPLTVLIDASGEVVRMYTGYIGVWEEEIDQKISEMVAAGSWEKKE